MHPMLYARRGFRATARWVALVSVALLFPSAAGSEEEPSPILLGMSTALTGPTKDLGQCMKNGVEAAIGEINAEGGVKGRAIRLIALDDGYEPARTAPNMRRLIEGEGVLAVVGNVGTPTAVAAIPIAKELKTPFYGAYTGAGVLRQTPPDRYVINYRASYAQETAAMVDGLIERGGLRPEEIAFFTQLDAYGDAGYAGGIAALKRHGLTDESVIAHGRYQRNTLSVENGLADVLQAQTPCRAVIMVGTYAPCAKFIRLAKEHGLDAAYLNVSFVGAHALSGALGEAADGVIVTQVVPPPGMQSALSEAYTDAMRAHVPGGGLTHASFEGYIAMRILGRALRAIEGEVSREAIVDAMDALGEFELEPGFGLSLSGSDHQASDRVWATVIRQGRVEGFRWDELGSEKPAIGLGDADGR